MWPGCGHNKLAKHCKIVGCIQRIQFTPDLSQDVNACRFFNAKTANLSFCPADSRPDVATRKKSPRQPKTQSDCELWRTPGHVDGCYHPKLSVMPREPINTSTFTLPAQLSTLSHARTRGQPNRGGRSRRGSSTHPYEHRAGVSARGTDAAQERFKTVSGCPVKEYMVELVSLRANTSERYLGASPAGSLAVSRAQPAPVCRKAPYARQRYKFLAEAPGDR